ncbi:MAG: glutamate-1-semialdehyde 2,1-aminomutase [Candidatus Latescibacteria bacterium]|nr:glutamate-1-semialdehyde 2,1-aminomutase [Candidatus Latescibacterota bacterium]
MSLFTYDASRALYDRAGMSIVGGVNSPARAFKSVGGDPLFVTRAEGCHIWDADGNRYIDYIGSWGPMIAGHAHPEVIAAVTGTAQSGTSFGVSTEAEIQIAEKIRSMVPSIELLRMVNSGTEATMSAVRLARGYTGRSKIIKFAGSYHGHGDSFLIKAGSGALTLGVPDSAGITHGIASDTLVAEYNNLESVQKLIQANKNEIAAIIVEPVVGNMGTVPPLSGFLQGLKKLIAKSGIVLIFDEVMTGFRLARGGAQELYDITPDLTTLGKIVGGGLPVGVYGGKADIMKCLAPLGPVYQAGTLSGNPLAVAAGLATLNLIDNAEVYTRLENSGKMLEQGLLQAAKNAGISITINRVGSMLTVFFTSGPVTDLSSASRSDTIKFSRFFRGMLNRGVLLPPSQFEAMFISLMHDEDAIKTSIKAAEEAFMEC